MVNATGKGGNAMQVETVTIYEEPGAKLEAKWDGERIGLVKSVEGMVPTVTILSPAQAQTLALFIESHIRTAGGSLPNPIGYVF